MKEMILCLALTTTAYARDAIVLLSQKSINQASVDFYQQVFVHLSYHDEWNVKELNRDLVHELNPFNFDLSKDQSLLEEYLETERINYAILVQCAPSNERLSSCALKLFSRQKSKVIATVAKHFSSPIRSANKWPPELIIKLASGLKNRKNYLQEQNLEKILHQAKPKRTKVFFRTGVGAESLNSSNKINLISIGFGSLLTNYQSGLNGKFGRFQNSSEKIQHHSLGFFLGTFTPLFGRCGGQISLSGQYVMRRIQLVGKSFNLNHPRAVISPGLFWHLQKHLRVEVELGYFQDFLLDQTKVRDSKLRRNGLGISTKIGLIF